MSASVNDFDLGGADYRLGGRVVVPVSCAADERIYTSLSQACYRGQSSTAHTVILGVGGGLEAFRWIHPKAAGLLSAHR